MIIYNGLTGEIIANVPDEQDIDLFVKYYPKDVRNNVEGLKVVNPPKDLENYKIINKQLSRKTEQEISEIKQYGRVLTDEERQLNKLKPSLDEIRKAEQTIEILTLIQEVI